MCIFVLLGQDIASITLASAARPLVSDTNLHVTGDLTRRPGERGHLELSWTYPGDDQAGEFSCEANAVNDIGHSVVFSTSLAVTAREPSLADLVNHIHDMEVCVCAFQSSNG